MAELLRAAEDHLAEDEAREAFEAAEKALAASTDKKVSLDALVLSLTAQLATSDSEVAFERAKSEASKSGDKKTQGAMLIVLAGAYTTRLMLAEAEKSAKEAKDIFIALGDKAEAAKAVVAASAAALAKGTTAAEEQALSLSAEAVTLSKAAGDKAVEAKALQQAAMAYAARADMAGVTSSMSEAQQIYTALGDKKGAAWALQNMAEVYLMEQKTGQALVSAKQALQLFREVGIKSGAAASVGMVVQSLVQGKNIEEALRVAKEEAAACRQRNDKKGEGAALQGIVQARLKQDDTDGALQAANRALLPLYEAKDYKNIAKTLHSVSVMQYQKGYWELSLRAAREAIKVLKEVGLPKKEASSFETLVAYAHEARGEAPPMSTSRADAMAVLKSLGDALEKQNVEAFEEAMEKLDTMSGITEMDVHNTAFAPPCEKDPKAMDFLDKHSRMPAYLTAHKPQVKMELGKAPGPIFCLRSFPVNPALATGSANCNGPVRSYDWYQTLQQMTLVCQLRDGPNVDIPGGWKMEDIKVELSKNKCKLTIGGSPVKDLTADLMAEIWVHRSWWAFEEEEGTFIIHVFKRDALAWKDPFYSKEKTSSALAKKTAFPWTATQRDFKDPNKVGLPEETDLVALEPGRPDPEEDEALPEGGYARTIGGGVFGPKSEKFQVSPDEIVLGINAEQDERYVKITIHFEKSAFEKVKARIPLECLLGADVREKEIYVFFLGDKQNPIIWADLAYSVDIESTVWNIQSTETHRKRQFELGVYSPTLSIKLKKWEVGMWDKIFGKKCLQHKLMLKDFKNPQNPERFEGMDGADTFMRAGYDLESEDFWGYVDMYARETMKVTGNATAPRTLVMA